MVSAAYEMNHIYLKPGELYFDDQPAKVTTVLGSCLAITMHHQDSGLGAICHAIQPKCKHAATCKECCSDASRYVACVIPRMYEVFSPHGIRPGAIEVKLFGGAAIIGNQDMRGSHKTVGQMNVEAAMESINTLNLRLKVANAGGYFGRKIIFNTRTGIVWMKKIANNIIELDNRMKSNYCSAEMLDLEGAECECW